MEIEGNKLIYILGSRIFIFLIVLTIIFGSVNLFFDMFYLSMQLSTFWNYFLQTTITILFGVVILIPFLSLTVRKNILIPIKKIERNINQVSSGNLNNELMIKSNQEFANLADDFNKMTYYLKANIDQRMQYALQLEKANKELRQANEELKQLDQLKSDFIANVSHELRTPLISIEGYVEYINMGKLGKINDKQKKALATSLDSITRLKKLINRLLLFSKMDAKQELVNIGEIDVNKLMTEIIKEEAPIFMQNKPDVRLSSKIEKGLPKVLGDYDKIKQVLINLIDNAFKFTHEGSITVIAKKVAGGVEFAVQDTGIGIPKEKIDHIFKRFEQVDSTSKRKFGGVGLGLAIVRQIVEMHEAVIKCTSGEGKGTTFKFVLKTKN
ncbi:hypothetical protein GOV04_03375 [Candidatus Woesearchaeota archaeon]|nr:hypothetical protein [Candidatus Woesearchaeota archaeon]